MVKKRFKKPEKMAVSAAQTEASAVVDVNGEAESISRGQQWVEERMVPWLDKLSFWIQRDKSTQLRDENELIAYGPIRIGIWLLVLVFGVCGGWAALAPLSSAAVAPGVIVLDANKKTIQHLEGGIIDTILVREGDLVDAGQPLIRLSETAARAKLELVRGQLIAEQAMVARLLAERNRADTVEFAQELEASREPDVIETLNNQRQLFMARKRAMEGKIDVLRQHIEQSHDEIEGLKSQSKSAGSQISFINEEIAVVSKLLKSGNAVKPRLLNLQRQRADLEGKRGEYLALIARAEQTIAQTELEIINVQNEYLKEVTDTLKETQVRLSSLQEQMKAAEDVSLRLDIVAPVAGKVTALKVHTRGGVIAPGEAVMDIVPLNDLMVVEARINPQDIDVVHRDLPAKVRLSAYKTRQVPPFSGEVMDVSADRFQDQVTGETYYLARVAINPEDIAVYPDVELYPGMPAEVLIVTGERTMLQYMFAPISDSFFRAMREQ